MAVAETITTGEPRAVRAARDIHVKVPLLAQRKASNRRIFSLVSDSCFALFASTSSLNAKSLG